jgi:hypothetical protein
MNGDSVTCKTMAFVAALRRTGLTAPMVLDGPMTGPAFLAYIQKIRVPARGRGYIVVLDNLPARKITESGRWPRGTRSIGWANFRLGTTRR